MVENKQHRNDISVIFHACDRLFFQVKKTPLP